LLSFTLFPSCAEFLSKEPVPSEGLLVLGVDSPFFLGLSSLFTQGTKGWTVLGVMIVLLTVAAIGWTGFWCKYRDGKNKMIKGFLERQRRNDAIRTLADDMENVQRKIQMLIDHTGAPDDEEVDVEKQALVDNLEKQDSAADSESISNEIQT
jgi:hypothetical protein